MNGIFKPAVLTIAAASIVFAPMAQASAHERWKHQRYQRHHQPVIVNKHNSGELIAAGIIGLAIGAMIAGAANQPDEDEYRVHRPARPRPERDYFPPPPGVVDGDEPNVIYDEPVYASAEPWTPQWYRYCEDRYRSFDGETGTYLGYDGLRHFCVVR
jgi:hypothetical protein